MAKFKMDSLSAYINYTNNCIDNKKEIQFTFKISYIYFLYILYLYLLEII